MRAHFCEKRRNTVIFRYAIYFVFIALVWLFPYSGDDWAWGSQIGLDRLANRFDNYNGRYAGNLLVMALTRNEALKVLFCSTCLMCVCLLSKWFVASRRFLPYAVGVLLLFLMPKQMFVQSVVWTAGFANYVPPILLTLGYFVLVDNIFDKETPQYRIRDYIIAPVIGFTSTLMENVTLYIIIVSGAICIFVLVRFRRVYLIHILHYLASICGTVLMFSNSVYRTIANGNDDYRSMGVVEGLKEMVISHTDIIFQQFFQNNVVELSIFSVLCYGAYFVFRKRYSNAKYNRFGLCLMFANLFSLFILYVKYIFPDWLNFTEKGELKIAMVIVFAGVAILYSVSALLIIILYIDDKSVKWKELLLLTSIPVVIAPLLVVSPIGPRCFFPPYLLLLVACAVLVGYLQGQISVKTDIEKRIYIYVVISILAMIVFYVVIYGSNHIYDEKRNTYAKKQAEMGHQEIILCELPYASWVWCSSPTYAPLDERYKLFYGIEHDVKLVLLPYNQFDSWVEAFDKRVDTKPVYSLE